MTDAHQPETPNVGVEDDNQNQGMAHTIDFMAFWLFIFIFVWFNFDQILPLLD